MCCFAIVQAIECRGEDAKTAMVKKGLDVAVTPDAEQKLVCAAAVLNVRSTCSVLLYSFITRVCVWPFAVLVS